MRPIVLEHSTITVHAKQPAWRAIDFAIRITPLLDDVQLGGSDDEKGYGGFSPRVKLNAETKFVGAHGEITPQNTQIEAGSWVAITQAGSGVAILTHPNNPGFPEPWILRSARSMQNVAYPGRQPVKLFPDAPLQLHYRMILFAEPLPIEQLLSLQQQFQLEESP
jgi:hypothetical protein